MEHKWHVSFSLFFFYETNNFPNDPYVDSKERWQVKWTLLRITLTFIKINDRQMPDDHHHFITSPRLPLRFQFPTWTNFYDPQNRKDSLIKHTSGLSVILRKLRWSLDKWMSAAWRLMATTVTWARVKCDFVEVLSQSGSPDDEDTCAF